LISSTCTKTEFCITQKCTGKESQTTLASRIVNYFKFSLTDEFIPWSWVLFDNLIETQMVKKFLAFFELGL
jgi:hypothetical protein